MADPLHRGNVRRLMAQDAQLVEVLPAAEYDEEHPSRGRQRRTNW